MCGLKFNQNIDIAMPPKIFTNHRAKESQAADVVLLAKRCELMWVKSNFCQVHILIIA